MKGRKLKEFLDSLTEEQLDQEVVIDTEGRCFNAHLIDATNVSYQDIEEVGKYICIDPNYQYTYHAPIADDNKLSQSEISFLLVCLHGLIESSQYEKIDSALKRLIDNDSSVEFVNSALRATYTARKHLGSWYKLHQKFSEESPEHRILFDP